MKIMKIQGIIEIRVCKSFFLKIGGCKISPSVNLWLHCIHASQGPGVRLLEYSFLRDCRALMMERVLIIEISE